MPLFCASAPIVADLLKRCRSVRIIDAVEADNVPRTKRIPIQDDLLCRWHEGKIGQTCAYEAEVNRLCLLL